MPAEPKSDKFCLLYWNISANISLIMAKLLKIALDEHRYDLAAYVLVYGLIKAMQDDKKKRGKGKKIRVLRSST